MREWAHPLFRGVYGLVKYVPSAPGCLVRYLVLRIWGCKSRSWKIRDGVTVSSPAGLKIGTGSAIYEQAFIAAGGGVEIGDSVLIAHHAALLSEEQGIEDTSVPVRRQTFRRAKTVIEDDVWIGYGAIILRGVTVGRGAVVGAGAVVTKDVPAWAVSVGVPARVMRSRRS